VTLDTLDYRGISGTVDILAYRITSGNPDDDIQSCLFYNFKEKS